MTLSRAAFLAAGMVVATSVHGMAAADLSCKNVRKTYDGLASAQGLPDAIFPNLPPPYEHDIETQNFTGNISCDEAGMLSEIRLCVGGSDPETMTPIFKKGAGVLLASTLADATADDLQDLWSGASSKFEQSVKSGESSPLGRSSKEFGDYLTELSISYFVEMRSARVCIAVMAE